MTLALKPYFHSAVYVSLVVRAPFLRPFWQFLDIDRGPIVCGVHVCSGLARPRRFHVCNVCGLTDTIYTVCLSQCSLLELNFGTLTHCALTVSVGLARDYYRTYSGMLNAGVKSTAGKSANGRKS